MCVCVSNQACKQCAERFWDGRRAKTRQQMLHGGMGSDLAAIVSAYAIGQSKKPTTRARVLRRGWLDVAKIVLIVAAKPPGIGELGEINIQHGSSARLPYGAASAPASLRYSLKALPHQRCSALGLAGAEKVNTAVEGPDQRYPQSQQRLLHRAETHKRPDQVKRHAAQIGNESEQRNGQMAQRLEVWMLVVSNNADDTAQPVQQECPEVRS